jgi:hypothetical protein
MSSLYYICTMAKDLEKDLMYEGVKALVDLECPHIHLPQQKLYTLYSLAFNYFLYMSDKKPGHYIIRVEDSYLLEKLTRKAKDATSRKFLQKLALPRRFKYGKSSFHLDFFNFSTWANTNDLPKDKIQGALIVKNATKSPIGHDFTEDEELADVMRTLPPHYYLYSLKEFVPKTITIAFDEDYDEVEKLSFGFIKEDPSEKLSKGVTISSSINFDDIEDS